MSIAHVENGNTEGTQVAVVSAQQKKSLLVAMASKYDMEPARFKQTVMATCFDAKGTEDELIAFLIVAHRYGLCPFRREIYAFPKKGGGIQPVVSVDGWSSIMNRHPEMDGIEFEYEHDEKGKLVAITSIIYRKDRSRPCKVTEWLDECRRNTEPWNTWTRRMLRHKALIQGARVAFSISGIMDEEEAQEMVRRGKLEKPANYEMANVIDVKPEGRASLTNELMGSTEPVATPEPHYEPELEYAAEQEPQKRQARTRKKSQPDPVEDKGPLADVLAAIEEAQTEADVREIITSEPFTLLGGVDALKAAQAADDKAAHLKAKAEGKLL